MRDTATGSEDLLSTEKLTIKNNAVLRTLELGELHIKGQINLRSTDNRSAVKRWYIDRLMGALPKWHTPDRGALGVIDLFSGCGGLSVGVKEAAEALGYRPMFLCGADQDKTALEVYRRNLKAKSTTTKDIADLVDFDIWQTNPEDPSTCTFVSPPEPVDSIEHLKGQVDLIVGGPPCQGHSNLNNHTRREDPRNLLYLTMPAIAVALGAKAAIIENVAEVVNDKHSVVARATALFKSCGYKVTDTGAINATHCGVAQSRKRHFLIATKENKADVQSLITSLSKAGMTVWDAIGDLAGLGDPERAFDRPAQLSDENQKRIDWLHENGELNLPNQLRPDCHKDGHTYPSIYGRLHKDEPSLTVTGGFLSPGRGRYIHPTLPRGLTPHEGARLQGFPDDFKFLDAMGNELTNKAYSKLIGNAVPPPLAFVLALAALGSLQE